MSEQNTKYRRPVLGWVPGTNDPLTVDVDVYRVIDGFNVTDPCLQHLIKKAMAPGDRGHKDLLQDYQDIVHSANSALDLIRAKLATTTSSEPKVEIPACKAIQQMGKDFEAALAKLGPSIRLSYPRMTAMSPAMAAPYGKAALGEDGKAGKIAVMAWVCRRCGCEFHTNKLAIEFDGADCPHCDADLGDKDKQTHRFAAWRWMDANFEEMLRWPAAHLEGFVVAAAMVRKGWRYPVNVIKAVTNYASHKGLDDNEAAALLARFDPPVMDEPDLVGYPYVTDKEAKSRAVNKAAARLAAHGIGPGSLVVISGTCLDSRAVLRRAIDHLGGKSAGAVTKGTNFLLVGVEPGPKLARAIELGVTIIFDRPTQAAADNGVGSIPQE